MQPAHERMLRNSMRALKLRLRLLISALGALSIPATAQVQGAGPPAAPTAPGDPAIPPPPSTRRAVTLKDALRLAAQQSPDISIARAQAALAEAGVRRAATAWQPDISANGTYDHTNAPAALDFNVFTRLIGDAFQLGDPSNPSSIRSRSTSWVRTLATERFKFPSRCSLRRACC